MRVVLSQSDRCAVDALLDHSPPLLPVGWGPCAAIEPEQQSASEVAAQRWLNLLSLWPASDPPRDIASRTLRFIQQRDIPQIAALPPVITHQQASGSH